MFGALRAALRLGDMAGVLSNSMSTLRSTPGLTRAARNLNKPFQKTEAMLDVKKAIRNSVPSWMSFIEPTGMNPRIVTDAFGRPRVAAPFEAPYEGFRVWPDRFWYGPNFTDNFSGKIGSPPPWQGGGAPPLSTISTEFGAPVSVPEPLPTRAYWGSINDNELWLLDQMKNSPNYYPPRPWNS